MAAVSVTRLKLTPQKAKRCSGGGAVTARREVCKDVVCTGIGLDKTEAAIGIDGNDVASKFRCH
jgi:hypothetical protein